MSPRKKPLPPRRPARWAEPGGLYAFRLRDGRVGACQVIALDEDCADMVALDYLDREWPTAARLAVSRVQRREEEAPRPPQAVRARVDRRLPWWVEPVGVIDPVERFAGPSNTWGTWQQALVPFYIDAAGNRPPAARERDATEVAIDLGFGRRPIRRDVWRVNVVEASLSGSIEHCFQELDALPALAEVEYRGHGDGLIEWLVHRRIGSLKWHAHERTTIDLAATQLTSLELEVTDEPVHLRVPASLTDLSIRGEAHRLTVVGADPRFPFRLDVHAQDISPPPRGLEEVEVVSFSGLVAADATPLERYGVLKELELRGAPGRVHNASVLAVHPSLRELMLFEIYDLEGGRWQTADRLDYVWMAGVAKRDVKALASAMAGVPEVRVELARTDEWIATNLDNPFRNWDEVNARLGRAARGAWTTAKKAAAALGPDADREAARQVLQAFVTTLNRHERSIETNEREQACDAFGTLARELGVDGEQANAWLDEWRTF